MNLSEREQELYDFIKDHEGVTVGQMHDQLSSAHIGALGILLRQGLIVKDKQTSGEGCNAKTITLYVVVPEEE